MINIKPRLITLATLAVVAGSAAAAQTRDGQTPTQAGLGEVHFEVNCNEAAQSHFNVAMAYYYSFAWTLIAEPLDQVLEADPSCGMAHWARALGLLDNPFVWPANLSPQRLSDGAALIEAARSTGVKSPREQDFVDALGVFFKDHEAVGHRDRALSLEGALEALAQRYPDDTDAAILHALVISANFDPTDKEYTNQLRAAAILEPIFDAQPHHPGVAHFLIHSYDYPPIANKGVDAARRYGQIAPASAHALHMPSHIFTRVGAWRESIESNRASAAADAERGWNTMHAFDYQVYAHLQLGEHDAAQAVLEEARAFDRPSDHFASAYAYAAMPARLALEQDAWGEAAGLELYPAADAYPWNKFPQAEAINAFARGLGAAKEGDVAAAQSELTRLQRLRDAASEMNLAYWAEQIDIQAEVLRGLAATQDGRLDEGIEILRAAAAHEDATEKHVVTPGPILPAREVLADILLEQERSTEALREYEAVLKKEPNRLRATTKAAMAAEHKGDGGAGVTAPRAGTDR